MSATETGAREKRAEGMEADPRWLLTQRIVKSPSLSRAGQLRAILQYIVQHSISNPDEPIHESDIAQGALGRRQDFNPLDDSIVRVQVAHLRKRLERYFSTEGANEEMIVGIALGSYEPVFNPRPKPLQRVSDFNQAGIEVQPELVSPLKIDSEAAAAPNPQRRSSLGKFWGIAGWAITVVAAAWLGFHWSAPSSGQTRHNDFSNPILHELFSPGADVNVVTADTTLVTLQNMIHSDISIADYLDPRYPDNVLAGTANPVLRSTLETLTQSRYTSLNDADVVGQCFAVGQIFGARTYVRFARYLHVRDFEHGNYIIVGSRRGNPWVSLFEPNLNFYFEEDPATHTFHFRNRHPKPGEDQTYNSGIQPGGETVGYVDIALLPNLSGTGTVLMLNGFSIETNEAAANLVFSKQLPRKLDQLFEHLSSNSKIEILLRVTNLDKSGLRWEVVSTRVGNA